MINMELHVHVHLLFTVSSDEYCFSLIGRICGQYCCNKGSEEQEGQAVGPEFDIGRNTLDLIYSQALCWSVINTVHVNLIPDIMLVCPFTLYVNLIPDIVLVCPFTLHVNLALCWSVIHALYM